MPAVDPAAILYAALLAKADGDDDTARDLGDLIGDPEQAEVLAEEDVVAKAFRKASVHAPAGGVKVGGKEYKGGEFIPGDVMDKATDDEKAAVEGGDSGPKSSAPPARDVVKLTETDRDKARVRLSSVGPDAVPSHWSYGDDEEGEANPGFQVWDDLGQALAALSGDRSIDGDYSPDDGYEHLQLVVPRKRKSFAGGNLWSSVQPDDIELMVAVNSRDILAFVVEKSGAISPGGKIDGTKLRRWVNDNTKVVFNWIESNGEPVKPAVTSTLQTEDE